jgi:hypothetical protein
MVHVFKKPPNPKKSRQFIEEKQQKPIKIKDDHLLAWI